MATKLEQLQQELYAKQNNLQNVYEQARKSDGTYDFLQADAFSHLDSQTACIDLLKQLEKEAEEKHNEVMTLQELHEREEKVKKRTEQLKEVEKKHTHMDRASELGRPAPLKSLGTLIKEAWPDGSQRRSGPIMFDREFKNWDISMLMAGYEVKTLMERTAGWAPEATRIPRIVEFAHRPIQVTDLFPIANTSQYQIKYMEETTSTLAATEIAEGAASPEAAFVVTERTQDVQKIAVHLTMTEEQLADVDQVAGFVDARLRFGVQQRLDGQLLVGDGIAPNLRGILNASPQAQATGGDNSVDAVYKAMVKVRVTGRASPSAVVLHPFNFQPIRLMKAQGMYVWGAPSEVGPMRLWGVPIVETDAITANTGLTGDFTNFAQLWMRQGVEVAIGYVGSNFTEGKQVVRVTLRSALCVYRAAAFCTITGLPQT